MSLLLSGPSRAFQLKHLLTPENPDTPRVGFRRGSGRVQETPGVLERLLGSAKLKRGHKSSLVALAKPKRTGKIWERLLRVADAARKWIKLC